MDNLWLALFWTGPIGIGVFLAGLGTIIWLGAKANEINKRTRVMMMEKDPDSKRKVAS